MPAVFLAVLACFSPLHLSATTVVVTPPNTTACVSGLTVYNTIQSAVNAVKSVAGSKVEICPGTYAEQVVIKQSVSLIGESTGGSNGSGATGANNPVVVSPTGGVLANAKDLYTSQPIAAQIAVLALGGTVNVENIAVDGSNNGLSGCATNLVGILYQNAGGTVEHVVTRYQELDQADFGCQDGLAIFAQSTSEVPVITIEDSSVHDYDKNGITAVGPMSVTISGNYVVGIGATSLIAQNGIQVSNGAFGKVQSNTVTDDVYINPANCGTGCYGSSGILLYDTGGASTSPLTISMNTVSNTQLPIVAYGDSAGTADWNTVSSNKVTYAPAAGTYLDDGIDLCSNNNMATSNTVYGATGSGLHIDSSCTESTGQSGNNTTVTNTTVNEACAGILLGSGTGNTVSGTVTYNVVQTSYAGDSCPAGAPEGAGKATEKLKPQPHRQ